MKSKKKKTTGFRLGYDRATQLQLHTLMLPGTVLMLLFSIVPLFGLLLAFKNYSVIEGIKGVFTSPWYGFQNFKVIFGNFDFKRMLVNTLGINLIGNLVNIVMAILFALFINEIARPKFKSFVQTVTYMPHFISTVVIAGMVLQFTATDGFLTQLMTLFGYPKQNLMMNPSFFQPIYVISDIWQGIGWGSIIYIAAIAGINSELYEAARMDGAGRWKQMIHVTLPGILPTIITMFILRVGNMMNLGFEKIILLYNSSIYETADVISTYVYRKGLVDQSYSFSTAVGLFNSVINLTLLFIANKLCKRLTEHSLW